MFGGGRSSCTYSLYESLLLELGAAKDFLLDAGLLLQRHGGPEADHFPQADRLLSKTYGAVVRARRMAMGPGLRWCRPTTRNNSSRARRRGLCPRFAVRSSRRTRDWTPHRTRGIPNRSCARCKCYCKTFRWYRRAWCRSISLARDHPRGFRALRWAARLPGNAALGRRALLHA